MESIRWPTGTFLGSFGASPTTNFPTTAGPAFQKVAPTQPPCSVASTKHVPVPVLNVSWARFPVVWSTKQISVDSGVNVTGNPESVVAFTWNGFEPSISGVICPNVMTSWTPVVAGGNTTRRQMICEALPLLSLT